LNGPVGPVIYPPGQYTHCVDRSAYQDVPGGLDAGFASILEFLLCEYLLGGKLVCLAGGADECAIGVVVGIEEVGYQKSGFEAIDNDFSFNLLLLPYEASDFEAYRSDVSDPATFEPHKIRDDVREHTPLLGRLMVDPDPTPTPLPTPREPGGTSPVDGYGVLYTWDGSALVYDHDNQNNLHKLWEGHPQDGSVIGVPIVHCECEGSRIYFVCQAMKPFLDIMQGTPPGVPGPSPGDVCHALLDWVPFGIGKAVCSIIEHIVAGAIGLGLAPAISAAFATAWENAQVYDDLFVTGPVAKRIHLGDHLIVTGRWTWDAGHAGHTELHGVKTIQRVRLHPNLKGGYDPRKPLPTSIRNEVAVLRDRWCKHVLEAPPPPDPHFPGPGLSGPQFGALTAPQLQIYLRQRQPENDWTIHPLIDGCVPEQPQDPIP
jgi:hypothetical protein